MHPTPFLGPVPRRRRGLWLLGSLPLALLVACGGGGSGGADSPPPEPTPRIQAQVDGSLAPRLPSTTARPLAAVVGETGAQVDFVAGELLVITDDDAALRNLLARYQGSVLKTTRFAAEGLVGMPTMHLVRVTRLETVDTAQLGADLARLSARTRGATLRASHPDALRLMALAASESRPGFQVSLNAVMEPQGLADGLAQEADEADMGALAAQYPGVYDRNAFNWPYMRSGGPQDIGVGEAWRLLAAAGRLQPRVRLLVLDGGFKRHDDLPALTFMLSDWEVPNAASCGRNPCPWHGTAVSSAAASIVDNGVGSAGSAGPVVQLLLGQVWGEVNSVGDVLDRFSSTLSTVALVSGSLAVGSTPLIVNISAATRIPAALDVILTPPWGVLTAALRARGVLLVASAGNHDPNNPDPDNDPNIDRTTCVLGICWEPEAMLPCEMGNVLCVGGIQVDNLRRHPGSKWGSDDRTVDLFAPFVLWTVDPDRVVNGRARGNRLMSGTSFSAPFVAGVAALVWAANPALSADAVERLLIDTATPSPDGQVRRVVNAAKAVRAALGPVAPRIVAWPEQTIVMPRGQPLQVALNSSAQLYGLDANVLAYPGTPGPMTMQLQSSQAADRIDGGVVHPASVGSRTITITVTDRSGATDSRSFELRVEAPATRLYAVLGAGQVWAGQVLHGTAAGFVAAAGEFGRAPCHRVRWTVPMERSGLGVLRPTGSLSTELEGLDTPAGPRTVALGCHSELHLDPGSRKVEVELLDDDGRTPMQRHTLWAIVGAQVDSEAPRVVSLSRLGAYGERLSEPRLLESTLLGYFYDIPWLRADIVDPGAQGVTSLSYSVESLVSGARLELPRRPDDRDHADDAWLPVVGRDTIAPWSSDWTSWFGAPGEPAMAVLRVSVVDNGLTTTRPYLVQLRIRQPGPR